MSTYSVGFDIYAKDRASGEFRRVGKNVDDSKARLADFGRKLRLLAIPIAGAAVASVKMAVDFQSSMQKINGLVGISQKQVDAWSGDILELGKTLPQSPKELADAMFFITSAGLRGKTALDALKASAKASAAGLGETKTVADAVTSAMNAYGKKNLSAADATDILTAAVKDGKLEASQLAPVIGNIIPLASDMGVSFDQVSAAIAAMSTTGMNAATAATSVQSMLSGLLKPSTQGADALDKVGLSFQDLRDEVSRKGLLPTLMHVKTAFKGNKEELTKVIPNVRALRGFLALTGKQAGKSKDIFKDLANATGTTDDAFKSASKTADFKFKKALSTLQVIGIEFGTAVLPTITSALEKVTGWIEDGVDFWKKYKDILGPVAAAVATFSASAWAAYQAVKAWRIAQALLNVALAANPIGIVVVAVGALVAGMVLLWKKVPAVREAFARLSDWFKTNVTPRVKELWGWFKNKLWPALKEAWQTILPGVKDAFNSVKDALGDLGDEIGGNKGSWKALWDVIKNKVAPFVINTLIPTLAKVYRHVLPAVGKAIAGVIKLIGMQIKILKTVARIALWAFGVILVIVGKVMQHWASMLRLLGKVPGFGWAKTAADKMQAAGNRAVGMGRKIRDIPKRWDAKVNAHTGAAEYRVRMLRGSIAKLYDKTITVTVSTRYLNSLPVRDSWMRARAGGGPVKSSTPYVVGEHGPEIIVPAKDGYVVTADDTRKMLAGNDPRASSSRPVGGDEVRQTIILQVDGRELTRAVNRFSRRTGIKLDTA